MKILKLLTVGSLVGVQAAASEIQIILPLQDLEQIGINPLVVREIFLHQKGIKLDWNKSLKVGIGEEGKEINFDSLDGISILVPADASMACPNKVPETTSF